MRNHGTKYLFAILFAQGIFCRQEKTSIWGVKAGDGRLSIKMEPGGLGTLPTVLVGGG